MNKLVHNEINFKYKIVVNNSFKSWSSRATKQKKTSLPTNISQCFIQYYEIKLQWILINSEVQIWNTLFEKGGGKSVQVMVIILK